jgi:hypothetical protein
MTLTPRASGAEVGGQRGVVEGVVPGPGREAAVVAPEDSPQPIDVLRQQVGWRRARRRRRRRCRSPPWHEHEGLAIEKSEPSLVGIMEAVWWLGGGTKDVIT